MCYAKPGPRCQGHASEKVKESITRLYEALPESYKTSEIGFRNSKSQLDFQEAKIAEILPEVTAYGKSSAALTDLHDDVRRGNISDSQAIQYIKETGIPMDVSSWDKTGGLPIKRFASFVSRAAGNAATSEPTPRFAAALEKQAADYRHLYAEKSKEYKSLTKGLNNIEEKFKTKLVNHAAKDLGVLSDPKAGKLAQEYTENLKELKLTSGYRRDLKKKADSSLASGDTQTFNRRMDEYESLEAEYSLKYGAWEKERQRKRETVNLDKSDVAEHDTVFHVDSAAKIAAKKAEKQRIFAEAFRRQAEADAKLKAKSADVDFDVEF